MLAAGSAAVSGAPAARVRYGGSAQLGGRSYSVSHAPNAAKRSDSLSLTRLKMEAVLKQPVLNKAQSR